MSEDDDLSIKQVEIAERIFSAMGFLQTDSRMLMLRQEIDKRDPNRKEGETIEEQADRQNKRIKEGLYRVIRRLGKNWADSHDEDTEVNAEKMILLIKRDIENTYPPRPQSQTPAITKMRDAPDGSITIDPVEDRTDRIIDDLIAPENINYLGFISRAFFIRPNLLPKVEDVNPGSDEELDQKLDVIREAAHRILKRDPNALPELNEHAMDLIMDELKAMNQEIRPSSEEGANLSNWTYNSVMGGLRPRRR